MTVRGSYRLRMASTSPAACTALTPRQDRAACAALPASVMRTRIVPWQPPSTVPLDGSPRMAKSPASQSGWLRTRRPRPLRTEATSSLS